MQNLLSRLLICSVMLFYISSACSANREFIYDSDGTSYRYTVVASGENYNFEFENSPVSTNEKLKAGIHVLQSIYGDSSVNFDDRQGYIRERATCSLFEGGLYNYTFCIFPNDFSPQKQDEFRGFVTQLPNWKWMVVWNLLPVILVFGIIFLMPNNRKNANR